MKILIGFLLIVSLIVIAVYISKTKKKQHKLVSTVKNILQLGFLIVLLDFALLFTNSESFCLFSYSLYFVATDWLLYYFFRFSLEYIGSSFEQYVKKKILLLLLAADSLFILSNTFFEHLFSLKSVILVDGMTYFKLSIYPLFLIHYFIVIMLVAFCLISLFYRAYKSPYFYRKKYLTIAIILLILVILSFLTLQTTINLSVIGYVVEGICIYYCALVYTPQNLLSKTLLLVAQDMDVALFVMDIEGKKLYSNTYADTLFNSTPPLVDNSGITLEAWCRREYLLHSTEFTKERSFFKDNEELILKIQLQRTEDANKQLQGGYFVIQDRTEEVNNLKREKYLATHDTVTTLYNKQYFFEQCDKYIKRHPDMDILMICTDIKDFKMINDFFGPKVGDLLLSTFAKLIREEVKGAAMYGRIENDVFGILMPKEKYNEERFVEQMQNAFSSCISKSDLFPMINFIGIYEITERNIPVSVMCDRARMAISMLKIRGDYHKRVAYYDNTLRENILREQELISDLDAAISEEQFKLYLQPQMSAAGKVLGAEALIRWIHPRKGYITPGEFIPVFEKNGLITNVDMFIWEAACKQLRKWKDMGRDDLYISVNISPKDFYFVNVYHIFLDLLEKYDINPKNLKLEITETAIVMDLSRQLELISRLRQTGFVVEMDDFGSGYSSLNMLKDIHVDVLKIDMAFLKKAEDEERSKKILQMVITLSKQLGMPVITEGVEREEQVRFLAEMGCDIFQGYYFAKPMPAEEFEEKYLH